MWILLLLLFSLVKPLSLYGSSFSLKKANATQAFKARKYAKSIRLFRLHLRQHPRDYQAQNMLAASYFHSGQPRKALAYFKRAFRFTQKKSYNLYYQGLCYELMEKNLRAKQAYQLASQSTDEYGERALFQISVLEYHDRRFSLSKYWVNQYLLRYPRGIFRAYALKILFSINSEDYDPDIKGAEKPDMEKALVKYHSFSLTKDLPHFWFFEPGFLLTQRSDINPSSGAGETQNDQSLDTQMVFSSGIGMGPIRSKRSDGYLGYRYLQSWRSDEFRQGVWISDPFDFDYFLFGPDLMQRTHKIFGRVDRYFSEQFSFSFEASFEMTKQGSNMIGFAQDPSVQRVLSVRKTYFLLPSFKFRLSSDVYLDFYLYLRLIDNQEDKQLSNQSLVLDDIPDVSSGFNLVYKIPAARLDLKASFYRNVFTYNDYWLDFQEMGVIGSFEHEFIDDFYIRGSLGYSLVEYKQRIVRTYNCQGRGSRDDPISFIACIRDDTKYFAQMGLDWNLSRFHKFSSIVSQSVTSNDKLKIYNSQDFLFSISYSLAFPGTRVLRPYLYHFGDKSSVERSDLWQN